MPYNHELWRVEGTTTSNRTTKTFSVTPTLYYYEGVKPEYGTHSFAWGIRDSQSSRGIADYSVLPSPIAKEDDQDHCPCPIRMIYGILHYARKQGVTFIPMLLFLRGQHLVNGHGWLDEEWQ